MSKSPEPKRRRSVALPESLWREVDRFRDAERFGTESEALRRLILAGLKTLAPEPTQAGDKRDQ